MAMAISLVVPTDLEKMDSCRVCMGKYYNMSDIFNITRNNTETISERIIYCTGLQITEGDNLPSHICNQCFSNLAIAYNFKTTCIQSNNTFIKLQTEPKTELDFDELNGDLYNASDGEDDKGAVEREIKTNFQNNVFNEDNVSNSVEIKNVYETEDLINLQEDKDAVQIQIGNIETELLKRKRSKKLYSKSYKDQITCKSRKKTRSTKKLDKSEVSEEVSSAAIKQRSLHCEVCQMDFNTRVEAIQHRKSHEPKDFICEFCGLIFQHRSTHYTHLRSHQPPRYACDQCDYRTGYKFDLVKHTRIHSGVKMYQCEFCASSFYVRSNLKSHIQRCHDKVKRYSCHICNYQFFDKTKMKMHIDSHNDIKRHNCEVCGSNFSRLCYLKKHRLKNHGIEPIKVRPGRRKVTAVMQEKK